jgi:hypothetical protein
MGGTCTLKNGTGEVPGRSRLVRECITGTLHMRFEPSDAPIRRPDGKLDPYGPYFWQGYLS